MTQKEREVLASAIVSLDWTNYAGAFADSFKMQLHSQDALDAFDRHIATCYHIEEYKCGNI